MDSKTVYWDVPETPHAAFGASSAERWASCAGSLALTSRLGAPQGRRTSYAAAEGTAAHFLASEALVGRINLDRLPDALVIRADGYEIDVDADMVEHVRGYVAHVESLSGYEPPDVYESELSVGLREVYGLPEDVEAFGTVDAVLLVGDTLHVVDLKYGKGKRVHASGNTQLISYAAGVLADPVLGMVADMGRVKQVSLTIYQPRISDEPDTAWMTVEELNAAVEQLREGARKALQAIQELPATGPTGAWSGKHLTPSREACQWCPARTANQCPMLDAMADAAVEDGVPAAPTNEQLADMKRKADILEQWIEAVNDMVRERLEAGESVPGYKLVAGRSGARKWADEIEVAWILGASGVPEDVYAPRVLESPTQLEKRAKKGELSDTAWQLVQGHIMSLPTKPSVVPDTDKRPALGVADEFDTL